MYIFNKYTSAIFYKTKKLRILTFILIFYLRIESLLFLETKHKYLKMYEAFIKSLVSQKSIYLVYVSKYISSISKIFFEKIFTN